MKIPGYSIQRQIGQGGMAIVYYAIQESLGRPVALKVMNPLLADRPEFSQRFLNEGRLLASLRHSHIITIYDIGASDQYHYISMEYVDGGDLKQRLLHGLEPLQALDYVITLGHCLKAAHDLHIVHRDIKPVNILFRRDGTLLLTDFGVAKNLATITELTTTGSMVGSPYYISPEQAIGRGLDGRADIYSLGIVFYEMLVGKRPFQGDSAIEIAMQHINNTLPPLPQQLSHLQPLLDKMTAKEPQDRFLHATSLLEVAQEMRESEVQHDASLTASSIAPRVLAVPHTVWPEPPARPETPDGPPVVADAVLEETLILQEPEESPTAGEVRMSEPSGPNVTVRRRIPAKIWLLTTASASALALAVVIGFKKPSIPTNTVSSPPRLTADTVVSASQTVPAADAAGAVEPVPPVDATLPMLAASSLPPAEIGQPTEVPQNTDGESSAEVAPPAPSATPDTRTAQIETLLSAAQAALADNRLTSPAEDNAAYYYQQVRALDPTHSQAVPGERLIADRYYELAEQSIHKGQNTRAKQYLQSGLGVQSDHPGLLALQDDLRTGETQHRRSPQTPDQPPQRTAQSRSRSDTSARRLRAPANAPAQSAPGVFSRATNFFRTSPRGQQFPSDEPRSINE